MNVKPLTILSLLLMYCLWIPAQSFSQQLNLTYNFDSKRILICEFHADSGDDVYLSLSTIQGSEDFAFQVSFYSKKIVDIQRFININIDGSDINLKSSEVIIDDSNDGRKILILKINISKNEIDSWVKSKRVIFHFQGYEINLKDEVKINLRDWIER